jgi:long-chain acyl-CoA synthetase
MKTLTEFFEAYAEKYASNPMMLENLNGKYESSTYSEIRERVHHFAAGLLSMGIKKGDRASLISEGRNDWVVSELGLLYTGAINVPLSVKLQDSTDLKFRISHSGSRYVIVSGNQSRKISSIKKELPTVEKIIYLDPRDNYDKNEVFFGDIIEQGKKFLEDKAVKLEKTWRSIKPDDIANICYTSGTTADPKGIMLSHRNYTANVEQALSLMNIPQYYCSLLILPWDHSFAHTAGIYSIIASGASMAAVQVGKTPMETLKNIPKNIKEIKPHFLLSVPSLAKNFRKNIEKNIREKGKATEKLFQHALAVAYRYNGKGWDKGKGWRAALKPYVRLYDRILFSKIREGFGGNIDFFIGGGALLDIELQRFFYAIGMPMYQGYGLSEASPVISSNAAHKHKMGSSGFLVQNLEIKILDEDGNEVPPGEKGEIVVKGENVMLGYWNNEEASRDTLRDGWLHTGDLGYLDSDGFLYVLGRFKSLLISDDGEKYSPEGIEEAFTEQSAFIDQVMLYNNQRAYTIVLINPNIEAIKRHLRENNVDPASELGQESALKIIESELLEYRTNGKYGDMFPQRWLPAAIGILTEGFTEDNRMMNSTMKMVRGVITETYEDYIEYLYQPESKNVLHKRNLEAISRLMGSGDSDV